MFLFKIIKMKVLSFLFVRQGKFPNFSPNEILIMIFTLHSQGWVDNHHKNEVTFHWFVQSLFVRYPKVVLVVNDVLYIHKTEKNKERMCVLLAVTVARPNAFNGLSDYLTP